MDMVGPLGATHAERSRSPPASPAMRPVQPGPASVALMMAELRAFPANDSALD